MLGLIFVGLFVGNIIENGKNIDLQIQHIQVE
jgi:hypothetical protein